jgi:hypothetical protein
MDNDLLFKNVFDGSGKKQSHRWIESKERKQ